MVGAYDKVRTPLTHVILSLTARRAALNALIDGGQVLDSRKHTPHEIYGYFMSLLVDTVRYVKCLFVYMFVYICGLRVL